MIATSDHTISRADNHAALASISEYDGLQHTVSRGGRTDAGHPEREAPQDPDQLLRALTFSRKVKERRSYRLSTGRFQGVALLATRMLVQSTSEKIR